jgi:hypothetical protein
MLDHEARIATAAPFVTPDLPVHAEAGVFARETMQAIA